jgi:N-acetylglucosamine-6-phosphate deacetylase
VLGPFLGEVARERVTPAAGSARVLPAHLESNFINPEYRGAQPAGALTTPDAVADDGFSGAEILATIDAYPGAVGIVTLAPERSGGLDLVKRFTSSGILASIGHSGATFEEAAASFAAGVSRATHLFSAMPPFSHRQPGLVGAILSRTDIYAEMICDGVHVHPAMMRVTVAAKGPDRLVGITDGTAASGLPVGSRTRLGGRAIVARDAARLDDGALAGSVLTMNRALTTLIDDCGMDVAAAARALATTPASDMRLGHTGIIAPGAVADLVVLDGAMHVEETWVAGIRVWPSDPDRSRGYGRW